MPRRIRSESQSRSPSTQFRRERGTSPASPPLRRRRNNSPAASSPPRTRSTRQLEERIRELEAAVAATAQQNQTPASTASSRPQARARADNQSDQQRRQRTRWVMFGLNIPITNYTPMCRVHREVACTHCMYFVVNRPYPQTSQMAFED